MKVVSIIKSVAFIGGIIASSFSVADDHTDNSGLIRIINTYSNGHGYVTFYQDNVRALSECNLKDSYFFDLNTPGGRGIYASLLTAKAAGLAVQMWGSDVCSPGLHPWNATVEEAIRIEVQQ